jgi:hypothetical protein
MGTVLSHHERLLFVVEMHDTSHLPALQAAIKTLELPDTDWNLLRKIPRDPRHHSKIDYERLREVLG